MPADVQTAAVHDAIAGYYSDRLEKFGATPLGVDWTCQPTQQLRFVQLLKLCTAPGPFSLNDIGCGYGALRGFLDVRLPGRKIDYLGVDLAPSMIAQAQRLWQGRSDARFEAGAACSRVADYAVASGIFNVRLDVPAEHWTSFIEASLTQMHACSRRGIAVNFLAALPPGAEGTQQLYRTDPAPWVAYFRDRLQLEVEVLAAYGMREFTLLGRT